MENTLGSWKKSVKIAMIQRDMDMEASDARIRSYQRTDGRAFQRQPYQRRAEQQKRAVFRWEGASELLGISPSTLADYELGNTKVIPVDKVALMADLYNCPELKTAYCKSECPIGRGMPIATRTG